VWVTPQKTSHAPRDICNAIRASCPEVNSVILGQGIRIEFQNIVVTPEMLDLGALVLGLYSKEIRQVTKKKIYIQKCTF
jgi:hypothetical protein